MQVSESQSTSDLLALGTRRILRRPARTVNGHMLGLNTLLIVKAHVRGSRRHGLNYTSTWDYLFETADGRVCQLTRREVRTNTREPGAGE